MRIPLVGGLGLLGAGEEEGPASALDGIRLGWTAGVAVEAGLRGLDDVGTEGVEGESAGCKGSGVIASLET